MTLIDFCHRSRRAIGRLATAALAVALVAGAPASAFDIKTHHYDNLRSGWNQHETVLTPTSVASSGFGLLQSVTLDEQVDAQPLILLNQTITGQGKHNVVYVATENDTVYAIDADSGAVLLSQSLGTPAPASSTGYCNNNSGNIGIGSTPVIDRASGTMYVVTDTYESSSPVFRLHALNLADLTEKMPSVVITASQTLSDGSTYTFAPSVTRQRAALLLANGNVYAAFASYCDFNAGQSRGWLLGWNATTLAPLASNRLLDSRAKSPDYYFLTSIWMSGAGPASDSSGSIYVVTGNSDYSGNSYSAKYNLAESAIRLSADLSTVQTHFTPSDYGSLDGGDTDFGSGGIMLLPPQPGSSLYMAVAAGKDGNVFLMRRAGMGGYVSGGPNNVLDTEYIGGGCWCSESYFTGSDGTNRVVTSGGSQLTTWKIVVSPSPVLVQDQSAGLDHNGQDGGFFTTVSSSGTSNGIIWAVGRPDGLNSNAVYLDAYDANTFTQLQTDVIAGTWPVSTANANIVPVVDNGKVYVASYQQLAIFGLGAVRDVKPALVAARAAPLPDGQHRLSGRVESLDGSLIRLAARTGKLVTVDATGAVHGEHIVVAGKALDVIGRYDAAGMLHATTIARAKDDPALWAEDR